MPSPPAIDIESFLAPISADNPAGEKLPDEVNRNLNEFRRIVQEAERAEDNKEAEWDKVIELAKETLLHKSKHLRPAVRLTEALVRQNHKDQIVGYAGLRDGLKLVRRLIEDCWDRLLPAPSDGDTRDEFLELRAADLNWLDEAARGALFPHNIKMVPVFGTHPHYSLFDMQRSQSGKGIPWLEFEKTIRETKPESLRLAAEDAAECCHELDQLVRTTAGKMERLAPGLTNLRQSVENCSMLLKQIVDKYCPAPASPSAAAAGTSQAAPAGGVASAPAPLTRDDCFRQLDEAARLLRKLEPHSPVPYLVQRAIDMRDKSFPDLVKELMKVDANVLKDLNKILGVREGEEKKSAKPSSDD
jgi:type VI secretion system protein ImpA